ncbi:TPA: GNAT family N-acetyltransferase [Legionella pneumophila]|nr:GNAT family N-acetyltransferase [Legionella pneumophila]
MSYFKTIETIRLLLRRPETSDIFALQFLWRNEIVRKYLGGVIEYKLIEEKIKSIQNHWDEHGFGLCAVAAKNSKEVLGLCGLHHSNDGVEISYMFNPEWWGKGIAREAIVATIEYGFNNLKIKKIIAITQDSNQRSCSLLERVGMQCSRKFQRFNAQQCLYELMDIQKA